MSTFPQRRGFASLFSKAASFATTTTSTIHTQVAIVGAGQSGIATAYYLLKNHDDIENVVLLDALPQPMAFTSAQSGENYRNWWPHPTMKAFCNRSIHLMEEISNASRNRIHLTRKGYLLATRSQDSADAIMRQLEENHNGDDVSDEIRVHHHNNTEVAYQPPSLMHNSDWTTSPVGVDVLYNDSRLIQQHFPSLDNSLNSVIHLRRSGDVSGQQMASIMLESIRQQGRGQVLVDTTVEEISRRQSGFELRLSSGKQEERRVVADKLVIAAGPFTNNVVRLLLDGTDSKASNDRSLLPIRNVFHQKVAFEDTRNTIRRDLPFCIDLDPQESLDWTEEETTEFSEAAAVGDCLAHQALASMPGAVHCRPDGSHNWVKLGWAFNHDVTNPTWETHSQPLNEYFPEIVLRGAARLHPSLKAYYDGKLPRNRHHYGGWYSMTEENWPIIGPLATLSDENDDWLEKTSAKSSMQEIPGAFVNCAPSGFGTMTACAGGELTAAWVANEQVLPSYAEHLSLGRYEDPMLMDTLLKGDKGLL